MITFPNGKALHITAPDVLMNITKMYTTEGGFRKAFIEECEKISTLHDDLQETTKLAEMAGTKMAAKVNSKLLADHAYEGDDSSVDEEDMEYDDTDYIDLRTATGSQLQIMPSSSPQDNTQIIIPNVQPKSERTVHMKGKKIVILEVQKI